MNASSLIPTKAPVTTRDFGFFYQGLKEQRFLIQRCGKCGTRRHPAGPMCPTCQSLNWTTEPLGKRGSIHSYIVHHYPPLPDYPSPHIVALVDMEEGVRVTGALANCLPTEVAIGMAVKMEFVDHGDGFWLHRFRPTGTIK